MENVEKIQSEFVEKLKEALLNKTFKKEEKINIPRITADIFILYVLPYYKDIVNFDVLPVDSYGTHLIKIETEDGFILAEILLSVRKENDSVTIFNILAKIKDI